MRGAAGLTLLTALGSWRPLTDGSGVFDTITYLGRWR
jgi:hypothetical protein